MRLNMEEIHHLGHVLLQRLIVLRNFALLSQRCSSLLLRPASSKTCFWMCHRLIVQRNFALLSQRCSSLLLRPASSKTCFWMCHRLIVLRNFALLSQRRSSLLLRPASSKTHFWMYLGQGCQLESLAWLMLIGCCH